MQFNIPNNKELILFDGVCNLCNTNVLRVIKNDPEHKFLFAPLQSNIGSEIINTFGIDTKKIDSVLLYQPQKNKLFYKSKAALIVASQLKFPYKLLSVFRIIPSFISDVVYDFIAKNRYKWYGKKESCMIPTPELKAKFLD